MPQKPATPVDFKSPHKHYANLMQQLPAAIAGYMNYDDGKRALVVNRVWVEDGKFSGSDFDDIQASRENGLSVSAPIYADIALIDKATGQPIDHRPKQKIGMMPVMTKEGNFILGGNKYYVRNQLRLRSGVYTFGKENGELVSMFNLKKGKNIELVYDKDAGYIKLRSGNSETPLLPVLEGLGLHQNEIRKVWGDEFYNQNFNSIKDPQKAVIKAAEMLTGISTDYNTALNGLKTYFAGTQTDEVNNHRLTGVATGVVTPELINVAAAKLMDVYRGDREPDDRDSLLYKTIHTPDDLILGRFEHRRSRAEYGNKLANRIHRFNTIPEILSAIDVTAPVNKFFQSSVDGGAGLILLSDENNPIERKSKAGEITMMGEGGISSSFAVPLSTRALHPTHAGAIDMLHTPEASSVGVTLHATEGAVKIGDQIGYRLYDARAKQFVYKPITELDGKTIAFPEEVLTHDDGTMSLAGAEFRGVKDGAAGIFPASKADYFIPTFNSGYGTSGNLIPMTGSISGNRGMFGVKMIEQAVPLKNPDLPPVRPEGEAGAPHRSPVDDPSTGMARTADIDGVVESVEPNRIWLRDANGVRVKHGIYSNYAGQSGSLFHHTPVVKPGDFVKAGQVIADSNFTRGGVLALGKNLKTAVMNFRGITHEDGLAVSESAAKKLTSQHMTVKEYKIGDDSAGGLEKYRAAFPGTITDAHATKLDPDGVIVEGARVAPGEHLILGLTRRQPRPEDAILTKINRKFYKPYTDSAVTWDGDYEGEVVKVVKQPGFVRVFVRTDEPFEEGDKLVGYADGGKGIAVVIPDEDMPRTPDGEPVEAIVNPHSVYGRNNPATILNMGMAAVAEASGTPQYVKAHHNGDNSEMVYSAMQAAGLGNSKMDLVDPKTGKTIPQIFVAPKHWLKLRHQVSGKFSARDRAGYDLDGQPLRGGEEGAKRTDILQNYALLAHGSTDVLQDISLNKSDYNPEMWRALKLGQPLPAMKTTFATEKFLNLLKGAGIKPVKTGSRIKLFPMTDADTASLSSGALSSARMLRAEDMREEKGGLFDPDITGGLSGTRWSHIQLNEPLPSPVMEEAIKAVTGLTSADLNNLVASKSSLSPEGKIVAFDPNLPTGGAAVKALLDQIDPVAEFENVRTALQSAKNNTVINRLNRKGRYLRALINSGAKPSDAYMLSMVPVVPPSIRPTYELPNGSINASSLNHLYRDIFLVNEKLAAFSNLPKNQTADLRADLYDAVKAMQGLGDPISNREYRGIISQLKGDGSPKTGFVQRKLIARSMDQVGRSTIVADPDLAPDEVGIPESMAWKLYSADTVKELVKSGVPPLTAAEKVANRDPMATKALDIAMANGPLTMNRAPSLHKYSVMGFTPHRVAGKAIKMPPLVFKGFNADVDGDSIIGDILITDEKGCPRIVDIETLKDFGTDEFLTAKGNVVMRMNARFRAACIPAGQHQAYSDITQFSIHKKLNMFEVKVAGVPEPVIASEDASLCVMDETLPPLCHRAAKPREAVGGIAPVMWNIDCSQVESGNDAFTAEDGFALGFVMTSSWTRRVSKADGTTKTQASALKMAAENRSLKADFATKRVSLVGGELQKESEKIDEKIVYRDLPYRGKKFRASFFYGAIAGLMMSKAICSTDSGFRHVIDRRAANLMRRLGMYCGSEVKVYDFSDGIHKDDVCFTIARVTKWAHPEFEKRVLPFGSEFSMLLGFGKKSKVFLDLEKYVYVVGDLSRCAKLEAMQPVIPITNNGLFDDFSSLAFKLSRRIYQYCLLIGSKKQNGTSRSIRIPLRIALSIIHSAQNVEELRSHRLIQMVQEILASDITYEIVESVRMIPGTKTAYDLSVPGPDVFCTGMGVSVKNTMMASAPISRAAKNQVYDMFPTRHLINPGTGELMILPKAESIQGMYMMTAPGKETNIKFNSNEEALAAEEAGKISQNDMITVGENRTNVGRIRINQLLPEKYRDISKVWDNKHVKDLMMQVAQQDPKEYATIVKAVKDAGDEAAYLGGMTLGVDDLLPVKHIRDKIYGGAYADWKMKGGDPKKLPEAMKNANDMVEKLLDSHYAKHPNPIWTALKSGALGKKGQATQMIVAPVLVNDHAGKTIPVPILRSYSEGLNFGDYLITMYGQRKGMIDRALSTSEPGEIQKEVVVAALGQHITEDDCGADGIDESLDDRFIYNRLAGADVVINGHVVVKRGDRITPMAVTTLKRAGVKTISVRSPLMCLSENGICSADVGFNERGERYPIGFNYGALAATTISEPLTQGVMKNFHQGGTTFGKTISGLDRVRQLVEIPKILANAGAISRVTGTVDSIEKLPSGDTKVVVGGEPHFILPNLQVTVSKGQKVSRGDEISTGVKDPRQILDTQGILPARKYLVSELHKTYRDGNGLDIDRRHFETIVRAMSNFAHIDDPGDAPALLRGDMMPITKVEKYNKLMIANKQRPIQYSPELRGVVQAAITSDDWLARMGARQLKKTLIDAVSSGAETNVGVGGHPVPRFIYGVHLKDEDLGRPVNVMGLKLSDLDFSGPIIEHGKKNAKPEAAKTKTLAHPGDVKPA